MDSSHDPSLNELCELVMSAIKLFGDNEKCDLNRAKSIVRSHSEFLEKKFDMKHMTLKEKCLHIDKVVDNMCSGKIPNVFTDNSEIHRTDNKRRVILTLIGAYQKQKLINRSINLTIDAQFKH